MSAFDAVTRNDRTSRGPSPTETTVIEIDVEIDSLPVKPTETANPDGALYERLYEDMVEEHRMEMFLETELAVARSAHKDWRGL